MTFILYTNSISAHQLPLAREIARIVGAENFRYVYESASVKGNQRVTSNEPWIVRREEMEGQRSEVRGQTEDGSGLEKIGVGERCRCTMDRSGSFADAGESGARGAHALPVNESGGVIDAALPGSNIHSSTSTSNFNSTSPLHLHLTPTPPSPLETCDVLLVGGIRPVELIERRLAAGKVTFFMSERWFKPVEIKVGGLEGWKVGWLWNSKLPFFNFNSQLQLSLPGWLRLLSPGYFRTARAFVKFLASPYYRFLPIGPWAARDMRVMERCVGGRCKYRADRYVPWGDFVEDRDVSHGERVEHGECLRVLWVGRMLDWKHIETIIKAVKFANEEIGVGNRCRCRVELTIVGDGPEKARLMKLAKKCLNVRIKECLNVVHTAAEHSNIPPFSNTNISHSPNSNIQTFSNSNTSTPNRRAMAEMKVEEWLAGVDEATFEAALLALVEEKRSAGEYVFEKEGDIDKSIEAAKIFFFGHSRRIVELSDGRCVYFAPDPRSKMRNSDSAVCWAEYAFHAVSSGGDRIPGKNYTYRHYSPYKIVNTDLIEPTLRMERCVPVLKSKPELDAVKFFGTAHLGGLFDVVVRLDEYGNVNANMTEVTFEASTKRGQKKLPQLVSLTEAIRTVVSHQTATGTYPPNRDSIAFCSGENKGVAASTHGGDESGALGDRALPCESGALIERALPERDNSIVHLFSTPIYSFLPSVPIREVRSLMRSHDVYVLSSSAQEGWGAVVPEALTEGMDVIGTFEAGASAALLPKENLFHCGDWKTLAKMLIKHSYRHVELPYDYTPRGAAERLVREAEGMGVEV